MNPIHPHRRPLHLFLFTSLVLLQIGSLSLSGCATDQKRAETQSSRVTRNLVQELKSCSKGQKIRVEVFPFRPFATTDRTDRIAHRFFEDIEHPGAGSGEARAAEAFRIRLIENLIRSPDVNDIVASRSIRSLASRERLFQMGHASPPTIQAPGRITGASFAVVGRYAKNRGNFLSIDLEAIDLSSDRVCWVHMVDVPDP